MAFLLGAGRRGKVFLGVISLYYCKFSIMEGNKDLAVGTKCGEFLRVTLERKRHNRTATKNGVAFHRHVP